MPVLRKNTSLTIASDDPLQFVMSDGSKDRYGDIVEASGWELDEFKQNPVALANHDAAFVCGIWQNVHVEGNKLLGHLQLAPAGTSQRIDELRRLVLAGILKACSVGFLPLESTPIPGGQRYRRQRLVECSIVATPANPAALRTEAKLLGVSDSVITKLIDRPPVNGSLAQRQEHARVLAKAKAMLARPSGIDLTKRQAAATAPINSEVAAKAELEHRWVVLLALSEECRRLKPIPGYATLGDWEVYRVAQKLMTKAAKAWGAERRRQQNR